MRSKICGAMMALAPIALVLVSVLQPAQAQTFSVLYTFGNPPDGSKPGAGLIMDNEGNLYSTTSVGGANGVGTVFELSPEPAGGCATGTNTGNGWCEAVLYSFSGGSADGANPYNNGLIMDNQGNLYGTTSYGGTGGPYCSYLGCGTVFKLSPQPTSGCATGTSAGNGWCETVLYSFSGNPDGLNPYAGLILDNEGNLYGTTFGGGNGVGTVFELSPEPGGGCTTGNTGNGWCETVLYSFGNEPDGQNPYAGVIMDAAGNLYGTTAYGGNNQGTVFKLSPEPAGGCTTGNTGNGWCETVLYSFGNQSGDGWNPHAGLVMDSGGNLYGTTFNGGQHTWGTVFQVSSTGVETTLHSFGIPSNDTGNPVAGLLMDTKGNLYGATEGGTLFEMSPPTTPGGTWTYNILWNISVTPNGVACPCTCPQCGISPEGTLIFDKSGNLYGTAYLGGLYGSFGNGTVFMLALSPGQTTLPPTSPAITSASSATFTVLSQGSFTVTTTGSPTPALAESGALPSGVTFTDNGNGTGSLAGTPTSGTAATYPITFTASSSAGSITQSFTLTVDLGAAITSGTSTTFTVGSAGSFTVTTVGTPTPALSETGSLPSGVTFVDNGDGTGTLSGTPASSTTGNYPITFTASNSVSSATQNFTLTVNQGPAITSGSATTFAVGTAGSFLVTATGAPTPALSETGSLPSGVTFVDNGNGTATLSGTPAAGSGGSYPLSITAASGVGTNATQSFTLTINQSLAITSGSMTTFTVGSTGFFSVTTTGFPVPAMTETGSLPNGVTFTDNGNGTATLSGSPTADTGGTYPLTITASNGGADPNAMQSFTLVVNQGAAILTGNSTTFTVGVAGSFTVTTTGVPVPALTETGTLPGGVTFVDNGNGTGTLGGTPLSGSGGSYAITFTASNGVGTAAVQSFTLMVNQGPAITSTNTATFTAQVAGSFTVTTTGDPTPALSETGGLPSGVTFVDNGNGTATLSGTAAAGTAGQYGFTIQASNGVSPNATQTFTLTVQQAPAITSASTASFSVGTAGTFTVTATGSPAPTLSETGTLPSGVTFNASTGVLSGTPAAGTGGTYTLQFTASNGVGSAAVQSFTLTVQQAPAITSASTASFTVGTAGTFTVTATGFPAPTLSETGTLPRGVTFNASTGVLSGTPGTTTAGTYSISFTAANGVGSNFVQSFSLIVSLPSVSSLSLNPTSVPGGITNSTGTVTLNAPAAGTAAQRTVTLSSSNTSAATVPGSVTVAAGATSATFTVTSHAISVTETANISATLNGGTQTAVLTVTPPPGVASLTLSPTSVVGGTANSTATVTLNAPAAGTAAQRTVTLSSSNTSAATVPASVTVAARATTATFTVTSKVVSTAASSVITATLNGSATATLTVDPLLVISLVLSPTSVVGGSANSTATVTLNAPAAGTAAQRTVTLSNSNTSAATVPGSVTVAAGATTATFTVTSHAVAASTMAKISATLNGETQTATLTVNP